MGWTTTREKFLQRRLVETTGCSAAKLQGNDCPTTLLFPFWIIHRMCIQLICTFYFLLNMHFRKAWAFHYKNPFPSQGAAFLHFGNCRKTQELAAKRNRSPKLCSQRSEEWPKSFLSGPFQKQNFPMPMSQLELLFSRQAQLSCSNLERMTAMRSAIAWLQCFLILWPFWTI